jgi:hypothetical protein
MAPSSEVRKNRSIGRLLQTGANPTYVAVLSASKCSSNSQLADHLKVSETLVSMYMLGEASDSEGSGSRRPEAHQVEAIPARAGADDRILAEGRYRHLRRLFRLVVLTSLNTHATFGAWDNSAAGEVCGVCRKGIGAGDKAMPIAGLGTIHLGPCPDAKTYRARVLEVEEELTREIPVESLSQIWQRDPLGVRGRR